jgi:hypothetical protein
MKFGLYSKAAIAIAILLFRYEKIGGWSLGSYVSSVSSFEKP